MKTYEVWMEGAKAIEQWDKAKFYGNYKAANFRAACKQAMKEHGMLDKYYNEKNNTWWACNFYDNEKEARKSFG